MERNAPEAHDATYARTMYWYPRLPRASPPKVTIDAETKAIKVSCFALFKSMMKKLFEMNRTRRILPRTAVCRMLVLVAVPFMLAIREGAAISRDTAMDREVARATSNIFLNRARMKSSTAFSSVEVYWSEMFFSCPKMCAPITYCMNPTGTTTKSPMSAPMWYIALKTSGIVTPPTVWTGL